MQPRPCSSGPLVRLPGRLCSNRTCFASSKPASSSDLCGFFVYGNLCYQVARLGRLRRFEEHRASDADDAVSCFGADAPGLTILIPSYKEEIWVIRQTLLSAALQDYPNKRVVLLLDDPPAPKTRQDLVALWAARDLWFKLQTLLASAYRYVTTAKSAFHSRQSGNVRALEEECVRLADCFGWTGESFEMQAKLAPIDSHTDVWFVEQISRSQPDLPCTGHRVVRSEKSPVRRAGRRPFVRTWGPPRSARRSLRG